MQIIRKHSSTSNIIRVKLRSATTGQGLTGLAFNSTGGIISTICDNEATATTYTVAGSTIETITTLATYAAPTATKCRFKEVDATNHKGTYELQLADARFAVAGAQVLRIDFTGFAGMIDKEVVVQLEQVAADVTHWLGTAVATPTVGGVPEVDVTHVGGTAQTSGDLIGAINSLPGDILHFDTTGIVYAMDEVGAYVKTIGLLSSQASVTAAIAAIVTRATPADVNEQVLDVFNVDTFAELASPPASTTTLRNMLQYVFMWFRNKSTQTATQRKLYADDTTTVVSTATVSDDGTTFSKGEDA